MNILAAAAAETERAASLSPPPSISPTSRMPAMQQPEPIHSLEIHPSLSPRLPSTPKSTTTMLETTSTKSFDASPPSSPSSVSVFVLQPFSSNQNPNTNVPSTETFSSSSNPSFSSNHTNGFSFPHHPNHMLNFSPVSPLPNFPSSSSPTIITSPSWPPSTHTLPTSTETNTAADLTYSFPAHPASTAAIDDEHSMTKQVASTLFHLAEETSKKQQRTMPALNMHMEDDGRGYYRRSDSEADTPVEVERTTSIDESTEDESRNLFSDYSHVNYALKQPRIHPHPHHISVYSSGSSSSTSHSVSSSPDSDEEVEDDETSDKTNETSLKGALLNSPRLLPIGADSTKRKAVHLGLEIPFELVYEDIKFGDLLGKGAFGSVFRGTLWGQDVAIKQSLITNKDLSKKQLENFQKEIIIMSNLRHPNIVTFLGVSWKGETLCLVTEYMAHGSLETLLQKKTLTGRRYMLVARDIARGLNWLHHKSIIHRDIKPNNILIDHNGTVKIADFGLSHVKRRKTREQPGIYGVCGTPVYMAPEVIKNQPYSTKADVFSFGVVLCEMLTGSYPYDSLSASTQTFEHAIVVGLRPDIPDNACPLLRFLIHRCWDAIPANRPDMDDIVRCLDEIENEWRSSAERTTSSSSNSIFKPTSPQLRPTQHPKSFISSERNESFEYEPPYYGNPSQLINNEDLLMELPEDFLRMLEKEKRQISLLETDISAQRAQLDAANKKIHTTERQLAKERRAKKTMEASRQKTLQERDRIKEQLSKRVALLKKQKEEIAKLVKQKATQQRKKRTASSSRKVASTSSSRTKSFSKNTAAASRIIPPLELPLQSQRKKQQSGPRRKSTAKSPHTPTRKRRRISEFADSSSETSSTNSTLVSRRRQKQQLPSQISVESPTTPHYALRCFGSVGTKIENGEKTQQSIGRSFTTTSEP